ncbi:unnamed protein product [Amoebophrya sp. A120]|nr:unnamed protein product [Amoebophrya sp. A120]|eukprot:GSA120T00013893001.1
MGGSNNYDDFVDVSDGEGGESSSDDEIRETRRRNAELEDSDDENENKEDPFFFENNSFRQQDDYDAGLEKELHRSTSGTNSNKRTNPDDQINSSQNRRGGAADNKNFGANNSTFWDPIEEEKEKKRRKKEEKLLHEKHTSGIGEGKKVMLHGLLNAKHLNGVMGYVAKDVMLNGEDLHMTNGTSNQQEQQNRVSVLLMTANHEEKKIFPKNLLEIHTDSIGRLRNLVSAHNLNGLLVQVGKFDLQTARYEVLVLPHAEKTIELCVKKIKPENIEIVRKYDAVLLPKFRRQEQVKGKNAPTTATTTSTTTPHKITVSPGFVETEIDGKISNTKSIAVELKPKCVKILEQMEKIGLPLPQLVRLEDLKKATLPSSEQKEGSPPAAFFLDTVQTVSSRNLIKQAAEEQHASTRTTGAVDTKTGSHQIRIVGVSLPRYEVCAIQKPTKEEDVAGLKAIFHDLCTEYEKACGIFTTSTTEQNSNVFFFFPHLAVKPFPLLKQLLCQYYPCFLPKLCTEVIALGVQPCSTSSAATTEPTNNKSLTQLLSCAWVRLDLLLCQYYNVTVYFVKEKKHNQTLNKVDETSTKAPSPIRFNLDSANFLFSETSLKQHVKSPTSGMVVSGSYGSLNPVFGTFLSGSANNTSTPGGSFMEKKAVAEYASWCFDAVCSRGAGSNLEPTVAVEMWEL